MISDMLAKAIIAAMVDYVRKHPELIPKAVDWVRQNVLPDFAALVAKAVVDALPNVVDKITDVIPGQFDDNTIDRLVDQLVKRLSGGRFGGFIGRP